MNWKRFHQISSLRVDHIKSFKKWPEEWITISFKSYPRFPRYQLPKPQLGNPKTLFEVLSNRSSQRSFENKGITQNQLATLLLLSGGINKNVKFNSWDESRRLYPSAGARYPLELYVVLAKRLKDGAFPLGIYHYNIKRHCLELILKGRFAKKISQYTGQFWLANCPIIVIMSGVITRSHIKYVDRGYRFALIETGHLGQNLQLVAEQLGLASCVIGGFDDEKLNTLLDIQNTEETVLCMLGLGVKKR